MKRCCKTCAQSFTISQEEERFLSTHGPTFVGKIWSFPLPHECPDCRLRRRLSFRNERHLYYRASALSGKNCLGMHAPDSPYQQISMEEWLSDEFEATQYGKPYDKNRSFVTQLAELSLRVPHRALNYKNAENSSFTNYCLQIKDCYLSYGATECEAVLYSKAVTRSRRVLDSLTLVGCEECYEGITSDGCTRCFWFQDCSNCSDSYFIQSCEQCSHCALCYGLYRKEYYVENRYVGPQGFAEWLASHQPFTLTRIEKLQSSHQKLTHSYPQRGEKIIQSEHCSGNFIVQSKNCTHSRDIQHCEDCRYMLWSPRGFLSQDASYTSPDGVRESYQVCSTLGERCHATFMVWNCSDTYYSMECLNCTSIFGSIGLQRKEYHILNYPYDAATYEALVAHIIEELMSQGIWGEYLPPSLSFFPYNDTIAQEYYPLTAQEAISHGWRWRAAEERAPREAKQAQRNSAEWDTSLLSTIWSCAQTARPYKLTPHELNFYREYQIAPPELCPDVRHARRLALSGSLSFWPRTCPDTQRAFLSSYPPLYPGRVLSAEAFRAFLLQDGAVRR